MAKIYLCSAGDYSDYKILGVFDNLPMAEDEKHAVKIANEQRSKIIALNQWPPS